MPVGSKEITVIVAETVDKAWVVLKNKTTGDIWHGVVETDTCILNMANNNIWGNGPQQWTNGNLLDVIVISSTKIGGNTHTLTAGLNEIEVSMATDTAIEINLG